MLEREDGTLVEHGSFEDRATWWTCESCGHVGPHVGLSEEGSKRCMGMICGGVDFNPNVPRSSEYWAMKKKGG